MRTMTYAQAINEAIAEEMARDDDVILYGQDVAQLGGIFQVTSGLLDRFGPDRVFDSPISENVMVGAGVGAAVMGLRPIVELQFADFIITAGDEIFLKAGMWRFMHGGAFKVPLVVRLPSGSTGAGPEHSTCPEAYVMHSPGLKCAVPSTPADAKTLLRQAIADDNPVMYFEHRLLYQSRGEVDDAAPALPFGKAAIRRTGTAVTVVAWQLMLQRVLEAATTLASEGIEIEVIDPRTLNPFDWDTVIDSVKKTGACLVVEEGYRSLGVGAEVGAVLMERAFPWLDKPFRRLAIPDVPLGSADALVREVIPSTGAIVQAVRQIVKG
ncbi:alpha-ketoacid dehydrogenase subunit beta [Rhizorhabdus argentea]|uniref:alpha-ketoacid dehydrogenase subunit beta n=1 Tax=Rhizorhabdus argentea TaxID=1387174 RepID=UPI0030EC36A8